MKKWLLLLLMSCQTYPNNPLYTLAQTLDSLEKRWTLQHPIDTITIDTLIQKIYANYYQDTLYALHLLQRCQMLKKQVQITHPESGF